MAWNGFVRAIKARVRRGTADFWEIRNDVKSMPHSADLGWLDTVMVWPGETVRIAIDFSQPFTGTQT